MATNVPRHTPARVLLVFTLLLFPVAVSAWRDAAARESLEPVDFPTAIGDGLFFQDAARVAEFTARVAGREMACTVSGEPVPFPDHTMWKTGIERSGRFYVYQRTGAPELYVRTAPASFIRVQPK